MNDSEIKDLLDFHTARINSPAFIAEDPVQFPRMYSDPRDCEIAALLSATIAWGKRSMIIRNAARMLALMEGQPYRYTIEEGYLDLPQQNIHRTFFSNNLRHWLAGLRLIYSRHQSIDDFARAIGAGQSPYPAVTLARGLNAMIAEACGGQADSRCLPQNLDTSALKRLNMALRWLVRDDGIVDLGIWSSITPAQLRIPLDVHVINTSTALGLLQRKTADRKAVEQLTDRLRHFRPHDPVFYDYALFGLGIEKAGI